MPVGLGGLGRPLAAGLEDRGKRGKAKRRRAGKNAANSRRRNRR